MLHPVPQKGTNVSISLKMNYHTYYDHPKSRTKIGGDFNRVIETSRTTGHYKPSRALAELNHGFVFKDTWLQNPTKPTYTHYSISGATKIDHIYTIQELLEKLGIEILGAAFTYHHNVLLRLAVDTSIIRMGRGRWKMNTAMFRDNEYRTR